jgi:hypothetical protein
MKSNGAILIACWFKKEVMTVQNFWYCEKHQKTRPKVRKNFTVLNLIQIQTIKSLHDMERRIADRQKFLSHDHCEGSQMEKMVKIAVFCVFFKNYDEQSKISGVKRRYQKLKTIP